MKINKKDVESLRVFGLIVFNIGIGNLMSIDFPTVITFLIAIIGNVFLVFITEEGK